MFTVIILEAEFQREFHLPKVLQIYFAKNESRFFQLMLTIRTFSTTLLSPPYLFFDLLSSILSHLVIFYHYVNYSQKRESSVLQAELSVMGKRQISQTYLQVTLMCFLTCQSPLFSYLSDSKLIEAKSMSDLYEWTPEPCHLLIGVYVFKQTPQSCIASKGDGGLRLLRVPYLLGQRNSVVLIIIHYKLFLKFLSYIFLIHFSMSPILQYRTTRFKRSK